MPDRPLREQDDTVYLSPNELAVVLNRAEADALLSVMEQSRIVAAVWRPSKVVPDA